MNLAIGFASAAALAACTTELTTVDPNRPPVEVHDLGRAGCAPSTCDPSCTGGDLTGDALLTPLDRDTGLRADWAPTDLVKLPKYYRTGSGDLLRERAAIALFDLVDAAYADGHDLFCGSSYRSFDAQCALFGWYAQRDGCAEANTYSARAGHSEHQLGTTCDLFVDGDFVAAGSPASAWLETHAAAYGFAMSYPPGTECDTQYQHEPWHYRYLGVTAARILKDTEAALGRRVSTQELIGTTLAELPAAERAAIEQEGVPAADDAARLCARYKVSWCQPDGRLVACAGAASRIIACEHGCRADPDPNVPDRCE